MVEDCAGVTRTMFWRVSEIGSEGFLDLVGVVGGTVEEEAAASVEERRAMDSSASSVFMSSSLVGLDSGLSSWREKKIERKIVRTGKV